MLWIENVMRIAIFLFLYESSLSGVTVETYRQKCNFFYYFIIGYLWLEILEFIYIQRYQLYLIQNLVLIYPKMISFAFYTIETFYIKLGGNKSKFACNLSLLLE
jgi:hypothetical protein